MMKGGFDALLVKKPALAKEFGCAIHEKCGKTYGDMKLPYAFHLNMVVRFVDYFRPLLKTNDEYFIAASAAWLHDTIEDCGLNYNDIASDFNKEIADIVYDVSNELGKNRKERHAKTLPKIKANRLAIFVKVCDRLANTVHSKFSDGSMYGKYVAEWPQFCEELWTEEFKDMFDYYEKLIDLK